MEGKTGMKRPRMRILESRKRLREPMEAKRGSGRLERLERLERHQKTSQRTLRTRARLPTLARWSIPSILAAKAPFSST